MTDEPRDLIAEASRGHAAAIETLLQENLPALRAFVRLRSGRTLRARESTSDLVQSTCRDLLQHMDRYQHQGESNFRRWLFTTALRKMRNRYEYHVAARRDPAREVASLQEWSGDDAAMAAHYQKLSTPSQGLMQREDMDRLETAFEQLPEHYREVITLSRIVGLSHQEVGESMGRTPAASRGLLHRALAELTDLLKS